MDEIKKKYAELEEKAEVISSVGNKLCDCIEQNMRSISYYEDEIAKSREQGMEDNSFYVGMIAKLTKENEVLRQIESQFWASHVF